MVDFTFTQKPYTPPSGDDVDFSFSADRLVSLTTDFTLSSTLVALQSYDITLDTRFPIVGVVDWFRPLTLRFDGGFESPVSPLLLRFDDTPLPPKPPLEVGIELIVTWDDGLPFEMQTALANSSLSHGVETTIPWVHNALNNLDTGLLWEAGETHNVSVLTPWVTNPIEYVDFSLTWEYPHAPGIEVTIPWLSPDVEYIDVGLPWSVTESPSVEVGLACGVGEFINRSLTITYTQDQVRNNDLTLRWSPGVARWICSTKYRPPAVGKFSIRFNEPSVSGSSSITLRFTASDEYCEYYPGGGIIDGNTTLPNLDFKVPIEPQIRRVYLMEPSLTCTRVSDGLAIIISGVSIRDARGQYAQSVSIDFSTKIDAMNAANELLLIDVNGYQFYAIAEQPSKRELFGNSTYTSSGRSRAAYLSDPWRLPISYTNATSRSFAGMLGDLLVNTGWTIELDGITDFNIPAGAFSVFSKSPIDAVSEAVSQVGCMLIGDEVASKLKVVPLYPTSPWNMATEVADVNIHDAVIIEYSSQTVVNKLCNVVWLRGEQQGISAKVKRQGTAGNIPTNDVSAQLLVDVQAARVAGTSKLIDTGNKERITVNLPIMNDLPPLTKGMLIGVTYRSEVFKATCDSVSITARVSNNGGIAVNQSVTLIKHLEY